MEVLYRGVKPSEVEYVGVCSPIAGGCSTKVKFKRREATEKPALHSNRAYLEVKCPVCENPIKSYYDKFVEPDRYTQSY